jgi:hypothetical protein
MRSNTLTNGGFLALSAAAARQDVDHLVRRPGSDPLQGLPPVHEELVAGHDIDACNDVG